MIHAKVFCPFERVSTLVANALGDIASAEIDIDFGSLGRTPRVKVTKKPIDVGFGFDVKLREAFMRETSVGGTIHVYQNDVIIKEYPLIVYNTLVTDAIPGVNPSEPNGDVSNTKVVYEEARTTMNGVKMHLASLNDYAEGILRPFYNYILFRKSSNLVEILGPAPAGKCWMLGDIDTPARNFRVGVMDKNIISTLELDQDTSVTPSVTTAPMQLALGHFVYEGSRTPFRFAMKPLTIEGYKIAPADYLIAMKIWAFTEFVDRQDGMHQQDSPFAIRGADLPLMRVGEFLRLTPDALNFYTQFVANSEIIARLFNRFSYDGDGAVVYSFNGKKAPIIGFKTSACFAISLTYMLSLQFDLSVYTLVNTFNTLVDAGLMRINSDGVMEGNTRAIIGNPTTITVHTLNGVYSVTLSRFDDKELRENELLIFGYDPTDISQAPGPDHYVVARATDGRLYLVFDPLDVEPRGSNFDITSALQKTDSLLIHLKGSVSYNG